MEHQPSLSGNLHQPSRGSSFLFLAVSQPPPVPALWWAASTLLNEAPVKFKGLHVQSSCVTVSTNRGRVRLACPFLKAMFYDFDAGS